MKSLHANLTLTGFSPRLERVSKPLSIAFQQSANTYSVKSEDPQHQQLTAFLNSLLSIPTPKESTPTPTPTPTPQVSNICSEICDALKKCFYQ